MLRGANLGLRFLLELAALVAVSWWGWTVDVVLAIVLPAAVALIWGAFVAPKARFRVSRPVWYGVQVVIFAAASLALGAAWTAVAGIALAVVFAVNLALLAVLGGA